MGSGLSHEEEAWILSAFDLTQKRTDSGEYSEGSIDELLRTSPFEHFEVTTHFGSNQFNNGTQVFAHSHEGNGVFMRDWPKTEAVRIIDIATADGTHYGYSAYITGEKRLLIERPGEKAPREVIPERVIESNLGHGLTLSVTGSTEVMRGITQAIQARQEARNLGLDIPTEGSMREFTQALEAAIKSGVTEK